MQESFPDNLNRNILYLLPNNRRESNWASWQRLVCNALEIPQDQSILFFNTKMIPSCRIQIPLEKKRLQIKSQKQEENARQCKCGQVPSFPFSRRVNIKATKKWGLIENVTSHTTKTARFCSSWAQPPIQGGFGHPLMSGPSNVPTNSRMCHLQLGHFLWQCGSLQGQRGRLDSKTKYSGHGHDHCHFPRQDNAFPSFPSRPF